MVTIEVGERPEKKQFNVHKNLICRSSEFFRSSFEGHFFEGSQQHLKLPKEDADVCEGFCDWLYSRNIRDPKLYTGNKMPSDLFWLLMYTMADRHNNFALQSLASDKITSFDQPESIPSAALIGELFETLMPNKCFKHYVANDRIGADVAVYIAKIHSNNYKRCKLVPQKDTRFTQKLYDEIDTDADDEEEHEGRPSFKIWLIPNWDTAAIGHIEVTTMMTVAELKLKIPEFLDAATTLQTLYVGNTVLRYGRALTRVQHPEGFQNQPSV